MRLAEFIPANVEPILVEWERFARAVWPKGAQATPAQLRNDAEHILRAVAADMCLPQSSNQQRDKAEGRAVVRDGMLIAASLAHGHGRLASGFDLPTVVAEYRALRATVLRKWQESGTTPDWRDVGDITRFNEAIDQSLAHGVSGFAERVERERKAALQTESELKREAEAASVAKDVFLATLSHEMRTPLSAIMGWLGILRADGPDTKRLVQGLDVIERNTRAQVQLIDDILDVSSIVAGKLRVEMQPCEVAQLVANGVSAAQPMASAKGVVIEVHLESGLQPIACDSVRIQQVVWNLLSNAVKFTAHGGQVRISVTAERDPATIEVRVADTGQGMSRELLPHVFDRFRHGDSSTRRQFGGLGLGLSIVKHIVEAHGGSVAADSAGQGHGSTFTVRLPAVEPPVAPDGRENQDGSSSGAAAAKDGEVRLDGVRVLVVDDEPDARHVLVMTLGRAGAIVVAASSVADALAAVATGRPDILVSDLAMPGRDGFDLVREIRANGIDADQLPAVALTAFARVDDVRISLAAGFQEHVAKPAEPDLLIALVARLAKRTGHRA